MAEEETLKTPTEALHDESETKRDLACIAANQDYPPEKSLNTEVKVAEPLVPEAVESRADERKVVAKEKGCC